MYCCNSFYTKTRVYALAYLHHVLTHATTGPTATQRAWCNLNARSASGAHRRRDEAI